MFELSKIYLLQGLKVAGVLGVALGLSVGVLSIGLMMLYSLIFNYGYSYVDYSDLLDIAGIGVVWVIAIAIGFFVMALVGIPLYNLIAEHFGGITIDLRRYTEGDSK